MVSARGLEDTSDVIDRGDEESLGIFIEWNEDALWRKLTVE
jgi:hypothetical protein